MLPANHIDEISNFVLFQKETAIPLFTWVRDAKDFTSLARTCKYLHDVSVSTPVIAFCSLPCRRHLLKQSLLTNSKLIDAAFKVIESRNRCFFNETDEVENQFYLIFRRTCEQLNVDMNNREFLNCALDIEGLYKYFKASMRQNVYLDALDAFSNQPIHTITISNLYQKVNDLYVFCVGKNWIEIEANLRRRLKRKKQDGFFEFARSLQDTSSSNIVPEIKNRLRIQFEAEKTEIQKELQILEDTYGCYGSVKESEHLMKMALEARVSANNIFMKAYSNIDSFRLDVRNFKTSSPVIQKAFNQLVTKNEEFCVAREDYCRLLSRRYTLVRRNEDHTIIGGKLHMIENLLNDLDRVVVDEVSALTRFYLELDRDVTNFNKKERHYALWRIIQIRHTIHFSPPPRN